MPFQRQFWPPAPQISAHRNLDFPQMFFISADRVDFYGGLLAGIRNAVEGTYLRHSAEYRGYLASTKQRASCSDRGYRRRGFVITNKSKFGHGNSFPQRRTC